MKRLTDNIESLAAILTKQDEVGTAPALMFSYGVGVFGRIIECHRIGNEFFLYGVTAGGDPRVLPSIGMAREIAASALP